MINASDILQGKILIVDDQPANILLLERMMRDSGYVSVTSTMHPELVCSLHLEIHFDLILLDLQMPGMDGFQVMEALKEIEPDGYLPVLAITAQPDFKLRALQAGAKDFISKPFELAEVLLRVHNMLEVRLLQKKLRNYNDLLEQRVREQTTLLAISHTLASSPQFQPGLILDQVCGLIEYTWGGLFVIKDFTLTCLALRDEQDMEKTKPLFVQLKSPETLIPLVDLFQSFRVADIRDDEHQTLSLRSVLDAAGGGLYQGLQSWMWVPLVVNGRLLGGFAFANLSKNFFTAHHAELAMSVADQSALTLINAELAGQAQALAVLEERERLSQDLHDAVNQSLFSAGLIVEVLPLLLDRDPLEARRSLEDLRRLTRGAMAEMRGLLTELRPVTLVNTNLGDLLRQLGNALSGRGNLPVRVIVTGNSILPPQVQIAFYRVCQEALSNIAKHAKASQVEIGLKQDEIETEMNIYDNGQGFDPAKIFVGHFGLGMMRERAESVGAQFSVVSQPSSGVVLNMRWLATNELPVPLAVG
jgi:two-component system nitrate/nitrite sensor histidine kinase NarX